MKKKNLIYGVTYDPLPAEEEKKEHISESTCYNEKNSESEKISKVELIRGVSYDVKETDLVRGVSYDNEEPSLEIKDEKTALLPKKESLEQEGVNVNNVRYQNNGLFYSQKPLMETGNLLTQKNLYEFLNSDELKAKLQLPIRNTELHHVITDTFNMNAEPGEMLNFNLALVSKTVHVIDIENGESNKVVYKVAIQIRRLDGTIKTFIEDVESDKIKSVDWLKIATQSLAKIPSTKEERSEFMYKIQRCIENEDVPVTILYPNAGWRAVPCIGNRYIFKGGMIGDRSPFVHTKGHKNSLDIHEEKLNCSDNFRDAIQMYQITKNNACGLNLLLYVHAAMISTLYENAGYPLNFIFGVLGITNSRKTSLVLAMAQIFDRKKLLADAEITTSTGCGMEKILGKYKDGIVIIDDFKPGVNQGQTQAMMRKLDEIVRLSGNRVKKARMTDFFSNNETKFFPITSACVITMELVSAVKSTLTRMFITEIDADTVDNSLLAYYQKNRWILPTHMYSYLSWITENYDRVIENVELYFPGFREKYKFAYGRYADMFATLMISANLLAQYALEKGFWVNNQASQFITMCEHALITDIKSMEERCKKADKLELVSDALQYFYMNGMLSKIPLTSENAERKEDVYFDETRVYIRAKALIILVNEFAKQRSEVIANADELIGILERGNFLDIVDEGEKQRSRKLPIQHGNYLRYLFIKKSELDKLLHE